nr:hypothetical protein [uncultured Desulfobacter sp.]
MSTIKTIAMIPARIGSTRLKMKNLALINGHPMISYTIKAAKEAKVFDRIILNSDHPVFKEIAQRYGVEFYHRPSELGSSTTKSDDVVMDFIDKNPCDAVAWVNPTSPLQQGKEVADVVHYFKDENLDSLITVKDEQVHCIHQEAPVNFDIEGLFAQTQDLVPVQPFVYSVMMWRTEPFIKDYKEKGFAFFCGKTGYYPVSKFTSVIIKTQTDLMLAEFLLQSLSRQEEYQVSYDELTKGIDE